MKFSFLRSIRTRLLLLVLLSVLPALGIVIYSGVTRLQSDIEAAQNDAMRVLQSLAYDHERSVENTRQFLMTLAKLSDVQNQNAPACNRLFRALLKENPVYTTILAVNAEGMVFANALPFTPYSVEQRKYFQDSLRTKKFSVGEYMIGIASGRRALSFAYPVTDANGRIKTVVVAGIDLDRYGEIFTKIKLPEGSVFGIFDNRNIRLYRSHEQEKYVGKADAPEMIKHMSAQPEEGEKTDVKAAASPKPAEKAVEAEKSDEITKNVKIGRVTLQGGTIDFADRFINPKQKAIIVSGFSETDRVNQAQALGAGEYVKKPYVLEKLGLAIRREFDKPILKSG